jgi:hypothetical protein
MEQDKKVNRSTNPWMTIWTEPRETISRIVNVNPNRSIWLLAAIYGFSSLLNSFQTAAIGQQIGSIQIYFLVILLSPIWGYISFSVWSFFVSFTGKLFKGSGTYKEVRSAYAWSCVPLTINAALWVVLGLMFGRELFMSVPESHPLTQVQVSVLFFALVVRLITALWAVVIYVNTLSEVQKYSVLKAIGNIVIAALCIAATFYCILFLAFKGFGGVAMVLPKVTFFLN